MTQLHKITQAARTRAALCVCLTLGLAAAPGVIYAQNVGSPGGSWSATWGFSSASDRSLRLQEAQAIRNAEREGSPTTVVTTNNYVDSRSNYQEVLGGSGGLGAIDFQIGDAIGQNTNAIGAMNTGSTEITVNGSDNVIDAINSADSAGCVEGSILTETLSYLGALESADSVSVSPAASRMGGCN